MWLKERAGLWGGASGRQFGTQLFFFFFSCNTRGCSLPSLRYKVLESPKQLLVGRIYSIDPRQLKCQELRNQVVSRPFWTLLKHSASTNHRHKQRPSWGSLHELWNHRTQCLSRSLDSKLTRNRKTRNQTKQTNKKPKYWWENSQNKVFNASPHYHSIQCLFQCSHKQSN